MLNKVAVVLAMAVISASTVAAGQTSRLGTEAPYSPKGTGELGTETTRRADEAPRLGKEAPYVPAGAGELGTQTTRRPGAPRLGKEAPYVPAGAGELGTQTTRRPGAPRLGKEAPYVPAGAGELGTQTTRRPGAPRLGKEAPYVPAGAGELGTQTTRRPGAPRLGKEAPYVPAGAGELGTQTTRGALGAGDLGTGATDLGTGCGPGTRPCVAARSLPPRVLNQVIDLLDREILLESDSVWESRVFDTSQYTRIGLQVYGEADSGSILCRTVWQYSPGDEFQGSLPTAAVGAPREAHPGLADLGEVRGLLAKVVCSPIDFAGDFGGRVDEEPPVDVLPSSGVLTDVRILLRRP